ncbi:putative quinol monooxygenase [Streptococcus sp. 27098_8_148]|jgi:antibiotic biosynthesis monooxygenase|uniref:antibiotic biosynthesis monooxygenase family protein n=1 Tax=Streptococcus TaxID=1301 RepID=UPI00066BD01A|nr:MULTISPECIES: putative quinol monooxygenase [Streptococcus]OFR13976.1 monooxygenase [Streptococcus sp. HMSC072G04]
MVLTVNIYYKGKDGAAIAFAKKMLETGIVAEIRDKEGSLRYGYFLPLEDPETVLLIDQWANQEALDLHHQSPTMQKILDLRQKYNLVMEVERFIEDESGIPEGDEQFIARGEL